MEPDYIDEAIRAITREAQDRGFEPTYLSSADPQWEPDYLVLEPGLSVCFDPMDEIAWVSHWSQEAGRYGISRSYPVVCVTDLMKVIDSIKAGEGQHQQNSL